MAKCKTTCEKKGSGAAYWCNLNATVDRRFGSEKFFLLHVLSRAPLKRFRIAFAGLNGQRIFSNFGNEGAVLHDFRGFPKRSDRPLQKRRSRREVEDEIIAAAAEVAALSKNRTLN